MTGNKILIIYHDENIINKVIDYINSYSDLQISKKFNTSKENINLDNYYINQQDINLLVKNNSILYITTINYVSSGVTLDDFYNNDVFILKYNEYNSIPDIFFKKYNILTVWIDSNDKNFQIRKNDLLYYELNFIENRLENVPYLYFLNDDVEEIVKSMENFMNE